MSQVLEAGYENDAFHPLAPAALGLKDGQRVRIMVATNGPSEILDLAAQVYAGLTESDIAEVETITLDRSFFSAGASHDFCRPARHGRSIASDAVGSIGTAHTGLPIFPSTDNSLFARDPI